MEALVGCDLSGRTLRPEDRLLVAILEDAVRVWRRSGAARGRRARRLANEVHDWFLSDATDHPFAFAVVCDHLHLVAAAVRARLGISAATSAAA
jgi:hypothetical protein